MNPIDPLARWFDAFQQRHTVIGYLVAVVKKFSDDEARNLVSLLTYYGFVATFPLLLALTAILGIVLRRFPQLQHALVRSAFAEFPIVGTQIHDQLGVAALGGTPISLTIGILGALYGGRGFANSLQATFNGLWGVPRVHRPGFPMNLLRSVGLMFMLGFVAVVTGAASWAAGAATSVGFGGLIARAVNIIVGTVLGWVFFLALFRLAAAGRVPTRSMVPGAAISALGWQILLTGAGVIVAHQLRHAQAIAGLFGAVLGLLAWIGLQATVIVFAIEADVVRAKRLWPRGIVQPPLTEADKAYYTHVVRAEAHRPELRLEVGYDDSADVQSG